jgi:hypothetical protein
VDVYRCQLLPFSVHLSIGLYFNFNKENWIHFFGNGLKQGGNCFDSKCRKFGFCAEICCAIIQISDVA